MGVLDDAFEQMIADTELEELLEDPNWVPDVWDLRRFRAFGASYELIEEAQKRFDLLEGEEEFVARRYA